MNRNLYQQQQHPKLLEEIQGSNFHPSSQSNMNLQQQQYNHHNSNNNNNLHQQQPSKIQNENYDHQIQDSLEVKEMKNRMKIIMNKFNNSKREKEALQKENKALQEEVMALQSNLRQMISGFSNTSCSFPMLNELNDQIQEFYKYDCLDIFFDLLCPELNMKGILFFFHTAFGKLSEAIQAYLSPANNIIKKIGCFESIDGPIMNVLRKSYQQNYKQILQRCLHKELIENICKQIQQNLKLGQLSQETNETIQQFLLKLGELLFYFQVSDPPMQFDYKTIGTKVQFNSLKHDPFDGFIKNKQECIIVLPSITKTNDQDVMAKALVLEINYEIPN